MIGTDVRVRLLNPGPVTLSPRVRLALARPDLCHREAEFSELLADVRRRLESTYENADDEYAAVLLTGSGTAAVEAMVGTLVPRGETALVIANGVYGERMAAMLEVQGKTAEVICSDWQRGMDLAAAEERLSDGGPFSHVLAVHHETTTGRLNDMAALGGICRRYGVPLLVDSVSSFGGEAIDLVAWNIEACASTANKCLHGVPGVSFVLLRKEVLWQRPSAATSLYLDLSRNYTSQCQGVPLFTPAVQAVYALHEALAELEETGGWRRRNARYRHLSQRVRSWLGGQGIRPLLDEPAAFSASLTAFRLPEEVSFASLFAHLKRSGFVIYPGQQHLQNAIFRVAVMGDLGDADIDELIECLSEFFCGW